MFKASSDTMGVIPAPTTANTVATIGANIWRQYKYMIISTLSMFLILNIIYSSSSQFNTTHLSLSYNKDTSSSHNSTSLIPIIKKPPRKNVHDLFTIEARLNYFFNYKQSEDVENYIWQIWSSKLEDENFPEACREHVERWKDVNENYQHKLLTLQEAEDNVVEYLRPNVPEVVDALRSLPNERLKYEFLKYLLIYINGGLYADIDTTDIKPLKFWYSSRLIPDRLMVGINADYNDPEWEKLYNRRLSFSNSLFKAKSHHPFLAKLISRITYIVFTQKEQIDQIKWDEQFTNVDATGEPLVGFTGSSIFTDTLFEYLNAIPNAVYVKVAKPVREHTVIGPDVPDSQRFSYKTFTGSIAPTQVDDVLIMPLITFCGYENSRKDSYDDDDSRTGYDKYYYSRPLDLTNWSKKKVKIASD